MYWHSLIWEAEQQQSPTKIIDPTSTMGLSRTYVSHLKKIGMKLVTRM